MLFLPTARFSSIFLLLLSVTLNPLYCQERSETGEQNVDGESSWLSNTRQLTFEGRRAGEGYFSRDGRRMVFQSEREPGNPFFQIYLLDFETGDIRRVSPGYGKTTCAWIHPSGESVLYASTQDDSAAKEKQTAELELRTSGKERRYSWDYDENYELYEYDLQSETYKQRTSAKGYDAEASWSPDGSKVVFASNRKAYEGNLTDREVERFKLDPAYMIDLYIMNADGTELRQLTDSPGYDGGPFFSPDGEKICWRRFSEDGATAEVMVMNVDGSQPKQITKMGAMSWAPFFHPSGDYLIFTTNVHGFANFELYVVDSLGASAPVRVTHTEGFDGLPVFTPDGSRLAWTTNRTSNKESQIFVADWNDAQARTALGINKTEHLTNRQIAGVESGSSADNPDASAVFAARDSASQNNADFSPQDILRHVDYLCRSELEGRRTGTPGERLATSYVAAYFENLGLLPAGDDGGWFQEFEFASGVNLGQSNHLAWSQGEQSNDNELKVDKDWRPVGFSATGKVDPAEVVFAGYGLSVPEKDGTKGYDSFVHLDVQDKWLMVFRFMPENISPETRQEYSAHSSLRYKAMVARDKGARGLVLVSGPNSQVRSPLVKLSFDGTLSGASVPIVSITDEVAATWLKAAGKDLKSLQDQLDEGTPSIGFTLPNIKLAAEIDIRTIKQIGRNVLARLPAVEGDASGQQVLLGAHVDHLGRGGSSSSLARDEEENQIHFGADDNASGVAAMLEVAEYLQNQKKAGRYEVKRDVLFAAWSGEEVGLLGSAHFAKQMAKESHGHHQSGHGERGQEAQNAEDRIAKQEIEPAHRNKRRDDRKAAAHQSDSQVARSHQSHSMPGGLYPRIAACLNLDMVGRLDKALILQGIGSSPLWKQEVERRNAVVGLPITLQNDCYIPTDASTFFMRGVPILAAFTGSHSEYHTPRDTPDKLNYEGTAKIARLMALVTRSVAMRDDAPVYTPQSGPEEPRRARLRAYLGTIPDYAESDIKGVKLSGVGKGGPAEVAGIRSGDIVVELAGRKIENIYDYTYAIEALKIGQTVNVVVKRDQERIKLQVTPGSRQ